MERDELRIRIENAASFCEVRHGEVLRHSAHGASQIESMMETYHRHISTPNEVERCRRRWRKMVLKRKDSEEEEEEDGVPADDYRESTRDFWHKHRAELRKCLSTPDASEMRGKKLGSWSFDLRRVPVSQITSPLAHFGRRLRKLSGSGKSADSVGSRLRGPSRRASTGGDASPGNHPKSSFLSSTIDTLVQALTPRGSRRRSVSTLEPDPSQGNRSRRTSEQQESSSMCGRVKQTVARRLSIHGSVSSLTSGPGTAHRSRRASCQCEENATSHEASGSMISRVKQTVARRSSAHGPAAAMSSGPGTSRSLPPPPEQVLRTLS